MPKLCRLLPAASALALCAWGGPAAAGAAPRACLAYGAQINSESLDRVYAKCSVGDTIMLSDDKYLGLTISSICNFDKAVVQIPGFVICVLAERRASVSPLP